MSYLELRRCSESSTCGYCILPRNFGVLTFLRWQQAKAFVAESSSPVNYEEINSSYFPSEFSVPYQAFPFTPSGIPMQAVQDLIESYLPPLSLLYTLTNRFVLANGLCAALCGNNQDTASYKYIQRRV